MSAGHPNGVSIDNLRNVAFAIHVGGNDSAYDRNRVAQEYIDELAALQGADPGGYPHQGTVHPGLGHWMELADRVSIPFLQSHVRSATPTRVVWEQHEITHARMYWLAVESTEQRPGTRVVASYQDQTVSIDQAQGLSSLLLRLNDDMLDLDQPVRVTHDGQTLFEGTLDRTIATLDATLRERQDPSMVYSAELSIAL